MAQDDLLRRVPDIPDKDWPFPFPRSDQNQVPPSVQVFLISLLRRIEALEAKLYENSQNSSRPPSPPSGVTFTCHDLRRTFATVAESLDLSAYTVKALLNHSLPKEDVTAGYLRLTSERLRQAMEKVEARILALGGVTPGASVVPFPAHRVGGAGQ